MRSFQPMRSTSARILASIQRTLFCQQHIEAAVIKLKLLDHRTLNWLQRNHRLTSSLRTEEICVLGSIPSESLFRPRIFAVQDTSIEFAREPDGIAIYLVEPTTSVRQKLCVFSLTFEGGRAIKFCLVATQKQS